ncbi:MAG: MFS transporter [Chloroflexi bacterium]|nr:MFS transporter [Chloroflexota bacterium]MDA1148057.1 MFS transporter [Chloroflexota bacterium]
MTSHPSPGSPRDVARTFIWWSSIHAVFHRGWWLVTSLYLVVEAELSAAQLLVYGAVLALTTVVAEVPTGVMADTISRKWSLVIAQLVMGAGMAMTGFVTAFPLILLTQVLWGLGWTFASGADIAWVTDELNQPARISRVLIARARWAQLGGAVGLVTFGALAWVVSLAAAIVVAGSATVVLGLVVAVVFPERNFTRAKGNRLRESFSIFRRGVRVARHDHEILTVFAAWLLVNAASEVSFLVPKQLIALGLPQDPAPIVWLTALGLVTLAAGAVALRFVEARIDDTGVARRTYVVACAVGAAGLLVVAHAPEDVTAMAGVILAQGVGWPVARSVSEIWVNRRATSDVRATVQSFLAQMESFGEILAGGTLAIVAQSASLAVIFSCAAATAAVAGLVIVRSRAGRAPRPGRDST